MKKILSLIIAVLLVLCVGVSAFAVGYEPGDTQDIPVYGEFNDYVNPNLYSSDPVDGKFTITTSDGVSVTVTPQTDVPVDVQLKVHVVQATDELAFKWFSDCTKDVGENILPFDIYFVDKDGNRVDVSVDMKIEITLPDGYGTPVVCYLSSDGKTTVLDSSTKDGKVIFSTDHNSYYVVAQKSAESGSVNTGDTRNILLICGALVVACAILVTTLILKGRKNKVNSNKTEEKVEVKTED